MLNVATFLKTAVQLFSYWYSTFLNGCQSGSACPWRVDTCQWRVDGDRRLSYWLDLLGVIRKIERRLNCVDVRSGFSQWERRWNPSSTWNYVSTRKQQNTLQLTTIKKFAVVSSTVLLHDVSARAGDMSMGIAVFPTGWVLLLPFEKLSDNCVNVRPTLSQWEKRWFPSSTWNYVSTRKQQNTPQLTTIKKIACQCLPMTCRHVPVTCRWGSPSFLLVGFILGHSKNWETVKLRQRLIRVQPMREKVKSPKHVKLRVDT